MELWIPITIAAAFFQNLRFMLQKHLKGRLSTFGVTYARFLFAAPLAVVFALWMVGFDTADGCRKSCPGFWAMQSIGGVAQIMATALLVALFSLAKFRGRRGVFQDRDGADRHCGAGTAG